MMVAAMDEAHFPGNWGIRQLPFLRRGIKVDKITIRFPRI